MSFRWIYFDEATPRSFINTNFTFSEGIQPYYWFGYFAMFGSMFLLAIAVFTKTKLIFPYIGLLILVGIGYFLVQHGKSIHRERRDIYIFGKVVKAEVIAKRRVYVFYKSNQNYAIDLKINDGSGKTHTITHNSVFLWHSADENKPLIGLEYKGKYFFGEEVGCSFKLSEK